VRDAGVQTELLSPDDEDTAAGRTIGAVCDMLKPEFPDLSISKLRYLEDQELVTPRRTSGGYRLYGPRDVERLRTILTLQRDEFLPLKVIREELDAMRTGAVASAKQARRIKRENLAQVLDAGARRVVVVSAILQAAEITNYCRDIKSELLARQTH
jgi:DNA-binding transcriptional MerR regulator